MNMNRIPVASSTLSSVYYHPDLRILELEFRSRAVYKYSDVSPDLYRDLLAAESKGTFFNARIRNCFHCQKIVQPSSTPDSAF
jgi:KTSC domain